jgi:hypothetical protein
VSASSDCSASRSLTGLPRRLRMESCQVRHRQLAQKRTHETVNHERSGIAIFTASLSLGGLRLRLAWRQVRRRRLAHLSTAGHYACVMIGRPHTALQRQDRDRRLRGKLPGERYATPPPGGRVRDPGVACEFGSSGRPRNAAAVARSAQRGNALIKRARRSLDTLRLKLREQRCLPARNASRDSFTRSSLKLSNSALKRWTK